MRSQCLGLNVISDMLKYNVFTGKKNVPYYILSPDFLGNTDMRLSWGLFFENQWEMYFLFA